MKKQNIKSRSILIYCLNELYLSQWKEVWSLDPYFVYGVIQEENTDFWVLIFYDHLMFSVTADFTTVNKMHNQRIPPDGLRSQ